MYSEEIRKFIADRNGILTRDEYMEITPYTSPQIIRVSYNTSNGEFSMYTNDNYEFHFIVRNNN